MKLRYLLFMIIIGSTMLSAQRTDTAQRLKQMGMINVAEMDSTIAVDLIYARDDNFTRKLLYTDLSDAYLHPDAMKGLLAAQERLQSLHPDYRLIVYDAARPMSIQQKMWQTVRGTPQRIYVSNPANGGGLHNYGLAVDVSIIDKQGVALPMGTAVDFLGREAHINNEAELIKQGKLTSKELSNRQLLRSVMRYGGFKTLPTEWWHFNWCSRDVARHNYKIIP